MLLIGVIVENNRIRVYIREKRGQMEVQYKIQIFFWSLLIGGIALRIAWKLGLFNRFHASLFPFIQGKDVIRGFSYFLLAEILLLPILVGIIVYLLTSDIYFNQSSPLIKGGFYLTVVTGGFLAVVLAAYQMNGVQRQQIMNQTSLPWYHHVGVGIACWGVVFPLMLSLSQLLSLLMENVFGFPPHEQSVVQHMRSLLMHPFLFNLTALSVFTIVPMTEEILFRGLLQSWLKRKLQNTTLAILASSIVFASFHFTYAQGWSNIDILFILFFLSCALGYLYERQRALWAPIGLHGFFNLVSLFLVLQEGKG